MTEWLNGRFCLFPLARRSKEVGGFMGLRRFRRPPEAIFSHFTAILLLFRLLSLIGSKTENLENRTSRDLVTSNELYHHSNLILDSRNCSIFAVSRMW